MGTFDPYYEGFHAFHNGKGIGDYDDYDHPLTKNQAREWKEGYRDAHRQEQSEKENSEWNDFSSKCPWHFQGWCRAIADEVNDECSKQNCAPLYFKENYHD